jgi:alpha-1,2-mannosyltransferase
MQQLDVRPVADSRRPACLPQMVRRAFTPAISPEACPILGRERLLWAWRLWYFVVAVCIVRGLVQPTKNTCFPCYHDGGLNWAQGNDLYQSIAATCRYSPLVHSLFALFSELPPIIGAAVWRLCESFALLAGLAWWLRSACPRAFNDHHRAGLVFMTVPLMMGNIYSGQANVLLMAALLIGVAALNDQRWSIAAAALAFSCYLKIYPIALALLLVAAFPRQLGWRFLLALAVGALLPFLEKDSDYVVRQYGRWIDNLIEDDRSDWPLVNGFRDGWMLVRAVGLPVSYVAYQVFTAVAGALIGLLVIDLRRRGDDGRDFINRVFGLGCCWMVLFGPATEGHTYILLSATIAWLTVECARRALPDWARRPVYACNAALQLSVIVQMTPLVHVVPFVWAPLAVLALLIVLVRLAVAYPARAEEPTAVPSARHFPITAWERA